jgi:hypothetical protein
MQVPAATDGRGIIIAGVDISTMQQRWTREELVLLKVTTLNALQPPPTTPHMCTMCTPASELTACPALQLLRSAMTGAAARTLG